MKFSRPDYNQIKDLSGKIPEDEPVFLLRGQDKLAPAIVTCWTTYALREGVSREMIKSAMDQALEMEEWQYGHGAKRPDIPCQPETSPLVREAMVISEEKLRAKISAQPPVVDTMNKFAVGAQGNNIFIGLAPRTSRLSKSEALGLAAWLVALATLDPEREFTPILKAVQNS